MRLIRRKAQQTECFTAPPRPSSHGNQVLVSGPEVFRWSLQIFLSALEVINLGGKYTFPAENIYITRREIYISRRDL